LDTLYTRAHVPVAILFGQARIAFLAQRREGWALSRETGRGSHTDTHCPIAIHAGPVLCGATRRYAQWLRRKSK